MPREQTPRKSFGKINSSGRVLTQKNTSRSKRDRLSSRKFNSAPSLRNTTKSVKILDEMAKSLPTDLGKMNSKSKSRTNSVRKINNKIETLNEKISKLERQLSEQRHLKNIEQHEIGIDSICHALDQLKETKEDTLSKELFDKLRVELSNPFTNTMGLHEIFDKKRYKKLTFRDNTYFSITRVKSGADGTVYRCVYKGATTAIKVVGIPQRSTDKKQLESYKKIMKEIYLLSQFNILGDDSPFLRYHDYYFDKNHLLIMMEFFPGEALQSIERVPNQKSKYYVFTFLMDAVFKMHKLHIVHADLHFGNVLYENEVDMKVIDMGRAICFNDEVQHDYCSKTDKRINYAWEEGFSEGHTQIAPWRKHNCGTSMNTSPLTSRPFLSRGCGMRDLMAGDLWTVLYKCSPPNYRKYLSKTFHQDVKQTGKNKWDIAINRFFDELPYLYRNLCKYYYPSAKYYDLEDDFKEFYGIKELKYTDEGPDDFEDGDDSEDKDETVSSEGYGDDDEDAF